MLRIGVMRRLTRVVVRIIVIVEVANCLGDMVAFVADR